MLPSLRLPHTSVADRDGDTEQITVGTGTGAIIGTSNGRLPRPQVGLTVMPFSVAQARQETLVAVVTRTGRLLRRLIRLPCRDHPQAMPFDGTERHDNRRPTGRCALIAASGPRAWRNPPIGHWQGHLAELVAGAFRAVWA
jgi:hypothetical protein